MTKSLKSSATSTTIKIKRIVQSKKQVKKRSKMMKKL